MSETILPDVGRRDDLDDYTERMSISDAAKTLGVNKKVIVGAIERGELAYIRFPNCAHRSVTRNLLAAWVRDYCVQQAQPIPG